MRDEIFRPTEKLYQLKRLLGGRKISLMALQILMKLQDEGSNWTELLPAASAYPIAMLELDSNGILARLALEFGGDHA